MPRGDRTGPQGLGPMTGRGAGYCAGATVPGYINQAIGRGGFRRGLGRFGGMGGGRGFRHMYWATGIPGWARYNMENYNQNQSIRPPVMTASQEVDVLKNQATLLQNNLNTIAERIQELENGSIEPDKPQQ